MVQYSTRFETITFRSVVEIDLNAQSEGESNSQMAPGTYQAIGGYGGYAMYQHPSPDQQGNRWYLFFDTASNGWTFMQSEFLVPGQTVWEAVISPFDNKPGQSFHTE